GRLDNGEVITPSDVAILVRNAKHGIPYAKELERIGIPVTADAANDIVHTPLMTELLNLLRCIDNPHRDLPLSEYLLSPSGGFVLEELGEIRVAASDQGSLYDAITASAEHEDFPAHEKCAVFLSWLEHFQKLAAAQSADRFLRLLYADPRLTPYAGSPELSVLYEQARTYQRNSWCGLYGFLKYFDKMIESGTVTAGAFQKEDDAVRIMTMHTSKGLEYPVVFLCSCDKRFSTKSMDETLLFHRKLPCAARFFDPVTTNNESGILREITKLEIQAEEAEESIRLLYVALTRARERLYVTGTPDGSYDKMLATADRILRGSRYSILYHGNFLRWILSALRKKEYKNDENPCTFRYIPLSDELAAVKSEEKDVPKESAVSSVSESSDEFHLIVERQKEFVYPLQTLHGIPTKIAASKLRSDLLDSISDTDEDDEALNVQIELMSNASPAFESLMNRKHQADAADIGTAMHSFLQFCDLSSLPSVGIEAEITRLVANRFILQETADILNLAQLESFVKSDLMTLLQDAETVYREQIFGLPIPLSAMTNLRQQDPVYREQTVLVQGSIDLLLRMKDGRLILFDYKTDHIPAQERKDEALLVRNMTQKHGDQLSCYARAVRALFGRAPDAVFIYSFPLGRSIPISVDDTKFDL
ncbi:MAG: PD-(D/E)XK nuclease family protein, partial [Clostridia bacterium]|nr:PD-(D/E)XK nuclease family protein [Clostridia bacterium]